jgi:hypothetical protein
MSALVHKPIQPPRPTHIGEQVYASMWEAMMTKPAVQEPACLTDESVEPLDMVLRHFEWKITQREASVVASVVCWLGTTCGLAMIQSARRRAADAKVPQHLAYLIAWTIENRRVSYVNSGVRVIESVLAPPESRIRGCVGPYRQVDPLPDVSGRDLEAVDHLMTWLGSADGERFIRTCEHAIREQMEDRELRERARFLRENWSST